jgi:hypothetical protein
MELITSIAVGVCVVLLIVLWIKQRKIRKDLDYILNQLP